MAIEISSYSELLLIGKDPDYPLNASYVLIQDIDASDSSSQPFQPIGSSTSPFVGSFDGSNYTIYNLVVSNSSEPYSSIFGFIQDATIKNLRLENLIVYDGVSSDSAVCSFLANECINGRIENITISDSTISSKSSSGLLNFLHLVDVSSYEVNNIGIYYCDFTVVDSSSDFSISSLFINNIDYTSSVSSDCTININGFVAKGVSINVEYSKLDGNSVFSLISSSISNNVEGVLKVSVNNFYLTPVTFHDRGLTVLSGICNSPSIGNRIVEIDLSNLSYSYLDVSSFLFIPFVMGKVGDNEEETLPIVDARDVEFVNSSVKCLNFIPFLSIRNVDNFLIASNKFIDTYGYNGLSLMTLPGSSVWNFFSSGDYVKLIYNPFDSISSVCGMVSYVYDSSFVNCGSTFLVELDDSFRDKTEGSVFVSGMFFFDYSGGHFENLYASYKVIGDDISSIEVNKYGLVVSCDSTPNDISCYYDSEICGTENSFFGMAVQETESMFGRNSYEGWDFDNVWNIVEGKTYPFLREFDRKWVGIAYDLSTSDSVELLRQKGALSHRSTEIIYKGFSYDITEIKADRISYDYSFGSNLFIECIKPAIPLSSAEDFVKIGNDDDYPNNGYYYLTADIDLSGFSDHLPLCRNTSYPFSGSLRGNGYHLYNVLLRKNENLDVLGLFGYVSDGTFEDIHLRNVVIEALYEDEESANRRQVASLVASCSEGCKIERSSVYITDVQLRNIGYFSGLINSYRVARKLSIKDSYVVILKAISDGSINAFSGIHYNTYFSYDTSISNCYFAFNEIDVSLKSSDDLNAISNVGDFSNCYFLDRGISFKDSSTNGITPLDYGRMTLRDTYSSWDFENIWDIVDKETFPFHKDKKQYVLDFVGSIGESEWIYDERLSFVISLLGFLKDSSYVASEYEMGTLLQQVPEYSLETFGTTIQFTVSGGREVKYIYNVNEFLDISSKPASCMYILQADLDLNNTILTPFVFNGVLDGNSYSISNIVIDTSSDNVGIFSTIEKLGEVKNLKVLNITVNAASSSYVGSICGVNKGKILNCFVGSSVLGNSVVGGVCGKNNGIIKNVYCDGTVSGYQYVGGLVGYQDKSGSIDCCYSLSIVSGNNSVGGLVGYSDDTGTVLRSYWDVTRSGQTFSSGGTGLSSEDVMKKSSYINWNFSNEWDIIESETSPFLRILKNVYVPNLLGEDKDDVPEILRRFGLRSGRYTYRYSSLYPSNKVTELNPSVDTIVNFGTIVRYMISKGSVPSVIDISSIEEIHLIGRDTDYPLTGSYILSNDIDAYDTSNYFYWNDLENGIYGFSPISFNEGFKFDGTFDGRGYSIRGIHIKAENSSTIGTSCSIFGYIGPNGYVKDLLIYDASIVCLKEEMKCSIVGNNNGNIERVAVSGRINVSVGLEGNTGDISLFSSFNDGTIVDCFAYGNILIAPTLGIIKCAGFVYENQGLIKNVYCIPFANAMSIYSYDALVAQSSEDSSCENSFFPRRIGSLEYFKSVQGLGREISQMRLASNYTNWDFENVWSIDDGTSLPYLRNLRSTFEVPRLINLKPEAAVDLLLRNFLIFNPSIRYENVQTSYVESQNIQEGDELKVGSEVGFVYLERSEVVPDFIGSSVDDVREQIGNYRLFFNFVGEYAANVEKGSVFDMSPSPGTLVPPYSVVNLRYSLGKVLYVPDFVGQNFSSVMSWAYNIWPIDEVENHVRKIFIGSNSVLKDHVIFTEPSSGTLFTEDDLDRFSLNVYISRGKFFIMPNLLDSNLDIAIAKIILRLKDAGLSEEEIKTFIDKRVKIEKVKSNAVKEGFVVASSPSVGQEVYIDEEGSNIVICVSVGGDIIVLDLSDCFVHEAVREIIRSRLILDNIEFGYIDSLPINYTFSQNPPHLKIINLENEEERGVSLGINLGKKIQVPDVCGKDLSSAVKTLFDSGFEEVYVRYYRDHQSSSSGDLIVKYQYPYPDEEWGLFEGFGKCACVVVGIDGTLTEEHAVKYIKGRKDPERFTGSSGEDTINVNFMEIVESMRNGDLQLSELKADNDFFSFEVKYVYEYGIEPGKRIVKDILFPKFGIDNYFVALPFVVLVLTSEIEIYTIDDLKKMPEYGSYSSFVLKNDISSKEVVIIEPIFSSENPFMGVFDGQGHVISNIIIKGNGIFGYLGPTAHVSNVTIDSCQVEGVPEQIGSGLICGVCEGEIKNVSVNGCLIQGKSEVGAICGILTTSGVIEGCSVSSSTIKGSKNVGGIVGLITPYSFVSNRESFGEYEVEPPSFDATMYEYYFPNASGYVFGSNVKGVNIINSSLISVSPSERNMGGICGMSICGVIENCRVVDSVINNGNQEVVGGICGCSEVSVLNRVKVGKFQLNGGCTIHGGGYVGGIVGKFIDSILNISSFTESRIEFYGSSYIGGICGCLLSKSENFKSCITNSYAINFKFLTHMDYPYVPNEIANLAVICKFNNLKPYLIKDCYSSGYNLYSDSGSIVGSYDEVSNYRKIVYDEDYRTGNTINPNVKNSFWITDVGLGKPNGTMSPIENIPDGGIEIPPNAVNESNIFGILGWRRDIWNIERGVVFLMW